jgi:hypothetical protein
LFSSNTFAWRHHIGEKYGGGIVFYVYDGGLHGLIAARADQIGTDGMQWYNGIDKLTGTTGDGVNAGAMNTALIVATQIDDTPAANFAAKVAADYSVQKDGVTPCTGSASETCYGDWYLPSKKELKLLYKKRDVVGGFVLNGIDNRYWSSTEDNIYFAWSTDIGDGAEDTNLKSAIFRVRAVRAF